MTTTARKKTQHHLSPNSMPYMNKLHNKAKQNKSNQIKNKHENYFALHTGNLSHHILLFLFSSINKISHKLYQSNTAQHNQYIYYIQPKYISHQTE